jgi:hypothetical protein
MSYEKELSQLRKLHDSGLFSPKFYAWRLPDSTLLDSYEAFQQVPFMHKEELRNTPAMDRTTTPRNKIYGLFSSSGTTGEKTYYIYSDVDKRIHEEFVRIFFSELGIGSGDIGGVMAPVNTGVMAHAMMWQFTTVGAGYVNCPEPTPENMLDIISKVPVTVVATRPSIASGVAFNPALTKLAQDSGVTKVLTGGGFLSEERRKVLEYAWNADCYNLLGTSEVFGPMAAECRCKDGLHYPDEYLMIEVIDPATLKPVPYGESGVAVYTTLWNKGFPLLRYWTNDLIQIDASKCSCGRPYPRIRFLGRLDDCIVIQGRRVFPVDVESILFRYGCIGEYCVEVQGDSYLVKSESTLEMAPDGLVDELSALFEAHAEVKLMTPGGLHYDGHGLRFVDVRR